MNMIWLKVSPRKAFINILCNYRKMSRHSKNEGRTGIHMFPKGLRLCLDEISDMHDDMSLTKIEKIAYCHGLAIASNDSRIKELFYLYRQIRRSAWATDDFILVDLLEVKTDAYKYARDAPSSATSIGILHDRDGMISRLSRRLGMTNTKLYPCLMVLSVMTWPNAKWQKKLNEEYNRFWSYASDRLDKLRTAWVKIENESDSMKTSKQLNKQTSKQLDK